jgi:hypothetical protein
MAINLADYGTVGDGVADDTAAVQAFINALVPGETGIVPAPTVGYKLTSTITIGNGSTTAESSPTVFDIVGAGSGGAVRGDRTERLSRFIWGGASGGTMLRIDGPMGGLRLRGLYFDCSNGLAGYGIVGIGMRGSLFDDVAVSAASSIGCYLTSRTAYPSGYVEGVSFNNFLNLSISMVSGASSSSPSIGMAWGGDAANPLNYAPNPSGAIFLNNFYNLRIRGDAAQHSIGLDMRYCDHNYVFGGTIVAETPVRCSPNASNTSYNGFPAGNRFYAADWQGNAYSSGASRVTTNGTFVVVPGVDLNYVEFLDNGDNYPGDGSGNTPLISWLIGETANAVPIGIAPRGAPLKFTDRGFTDTLSNFSAFTQLNSNAYPIRAGALNVPGAGLRVRVSGTYGNATNAVARLQLRIGSSTVLDTTGLGVGAAGSNQLWFLEYDAVTRVTGSSTGQLLSGMMRYALASVGSGTFLIAPGAGLLPSLDLTSDQTVTVWVAFGAASTSNVFTLGALTVEIVYPPEENLA